MRQLNSFFDAVPGAIFGSSQVILDKITELVTYHLELKKYTGPMTGMDVSDIYPSPQLLEELFRSSFVLRFSKKSPMLGIYCCTVSYLLSNAGWELFLEEGEVMQVARNSVAFKVPNGLPGKLNFLDPLSSYLEVEIQLPANVVAHQLFQNIRSTFFMAIRQAVKTLHYDVITRAVLPMSRREL